MTALERRTSINGRVRHAGAEQEDRFAEHTSAKVGCSTCTPERFDEGDGKRGGAAELGSDGRPWRGDKPGWVDQATSRGLGRERRERYERGRFADVSAGDHGAVPKEAQQVEEARADADDPESDREHADAEPRGDGLVCFATGHGRQRVENDLGAGDLAR
jgi:hypothetical protein